MAKIKICIGLTLWLDYELQRRGHVIYLTMIEVRCDTGVETTVALLYNGEVVLCSLWQVTFLQEGKFRKSLIVQSG